MEIDLMANKGKEEITKADAKCDSETDALTHIPGPLGGPTPTGTKSSRGEGLEGKSKDVADDKASAILGEKNDTKRTRRL